MPHMSAPVIGKLYAMMKFVLFLLLFVSFSGWSCERLIGTYKSVSETHWNFELRITADSAFLKYTDYVSGVKDTRTDYTVESEGYCEISDNGYLLVFAHRSFELTYSKQLTHSFFGGKGESEGISGEFIEGQIVHLWKGK